MKFLILFAMLVMSGRSYANECTPYFGNSKESNPPELSIANKMAIQEKYRDYYLDRAPKPQPLAAAFSGVFNGKMSVAAFDQFVEAYKQKKSMTLKVLISKAEWAELHNESPKYFPDRTPLSLIKAFSREQNLTFMVENETSDFYFISFESNKPSALDGLSKLPHSVFAALTYTGGNPTNKLFQVSDAQFMSLANYTRARLFDAPVNIRYSFIHSVKDAKMSLDAAKALVNFKKEPVYLDYHVSQHTMKNMTSRHFKGTKEEIEYILRSYDMESQSLGENKDLVSYRIKINSEKALEMLVYLLGNEFKGTVTLSER